MIKLSVYIQIATSNHSNIYQKCQDIFWCFVDFHNVIVFNTCWYTQIVNVSEETDRTIPAQWQTRNGRIEKNK